MENIINGLKQIKTRVDSGTITTVNGTETLLSKQLANMLEEAINYTHCCTELKDKESPTFEDYIKENGFTHKIDYTYLDADGNEWLEEEIKILMKPDY